METKQCREKTIDYLHRFGVKLPAGLPLLDWPLPCREVTSVFNRILCLHAVAACSYGFNRSAAFSWMTREGVDGALTREEREFVSKGEGDVKRIQTRIEGLWALAWSVQVIPTMEFHKSCDNSLARVLPNLKTAESSTVLRSSVSLRPIQSLAEKLDLAYCLHWLTRSHLLIGVLAGLAPYIVIERRHALEWLLSQDAWDDITLDT